MSNNDPPAVMLMALDWEEALISYSLPEMSVVEVRRSGLESGTPIRTMEAGAVGRVGLTGLSPETDYEVEVRWNGGRQGLAFRTLPAPQGSLRAAWAALADTHVSEKNENRKGRLLVESGSILRDLVAEWNGLNLDGVLIAGDLTNNGRRQEYALAREALGQLVCPLLATPGDHDIRGGDDAPWQEAFGPRSWRRQLGRFMVVGLDTSGYSLGPEGRRQIEEALALDAEALLLLSHLQLFPDAYIRFGKQKVIRDYEANRPLLDQLAQRPAVVYAGHQNALSRLTAGRLTQVSLPQPVQFPCGWVLARVYGDRVYHTYRPIRSEVLNNYSRTAANDAAEQGHEPQWRQAYRMGAGVGSANFVIDLAAQEADR